MLAVNNLLHTSHQEHYPEELITNNTKVFPHSNMVNNLNNKRRGICFSENATIYHLLDVPVVTDMTEDEVNNRWYTSDEMRTFLLSAKKSCTDFLEARNNEREPSESIDMRGLDHQVSIIRKRKKEMAIKVVLECQRRLRIRAATTTVKIDIETYLSLVSDKVTRFAKDIALRTALNDYFVAYPERKVELEPLLREATEAISSSRKRKAAIDTSITRGVHSGQRSVRMRLIQETTVS